MLLDDPERHGESEARSLAPVFGRKEGVKDVRDDMLGDAVPVVPNADGNIARLKILFNADSQKAAAGHRIQRVQDQVQKNLVQVLLIPMDGRKVLIHFELYLRLLEFDLVRSEPQGFVKQVPDRHRLRFDFALPGEIQQVPDDPSRPLRLPRQIPDHVQPFLIVQAVVILFQHSGRKRDVVQRVIQLVGDPRRQRAHGTQLVGLDEQIVAALQFFHHVVQGNGQVRELILETPRRRNRSKIPLGDSFGNVQHAAQGPEHLTRQEIRGVNDQGQQYRQKGERKPLEKLEHEIHALAFPFRQIQGLRDHGRPMLPQLRFDLRSIGGRSPGFRPEPLQQLRVPFQMALHAQVLVFSDHAFEPRLPGGQQGRSIPDMFLHIPEIRPVKEVVLLEAAGLLNLCGVAV